ncbi:MAG: 3'(2'),5'-bisphosphate nucleotidase CysQ [SAR86 cluster bacterium]|jgi:3'(2'), 5'-bisphosphate nucleotidase|nr:3'(2'),5'-bisphosphate nucleotidase CysQ [SAR86 cluster bacterium]
MDLEKLAKKVLEISSSASKAVMAVYDSGDINQENKDDGSPLTEADLNSNRIICDGLKGIQLDIPILSEEQSVEADLSINTFWLVDPLDGTKEFLNRNGEFSVNIALISNNSPVLGIVQAPAIDEVYLGMAEIGAFKIKSKSKERISSIPMTKDLCRIVVSRSHQSSKDTRLIRMAGRNFKKVELLKAGSSLKLCRVAEGLADVYPRLGPTYQWDIAAGQAVLEAAGGEVRALNGNRLSYIFNRDQLNPEFLALGNKGEDWQPLLIK